MMRFNLCIWFLTIIVACEKHNFPDYSQEGPQLQHLEAEGFYKARFFSINQKSKRKVRAQTLLWIKGQQFYAKITMDSGPAKVRYQQYIHEGPLCPGPQDDLNGDHKLDISEVLAASGEMLVPLDGNLKSQGMGSEIFPVSDKEGKYYYSQATSVLKMMNDLYLEDKDPVDGLKKLQRHEKLDLDRRTIILYGSETDPLLPVACAELKEDFTYRE